MAAKTMLAGICDHSKAWEVYSIPPDAITIVPGWNARTDFSGEDELCDFIRENGVPGALEVCKTDDGILELTAGERRLRAVRRLISEGYIIERVPVRIVKTSGGSVDEQKKALETAKTRRKRNRLIVSMGDGGAKCSGIKGGSCGVIEKLFTDTDFKRSLIFAGYDIATLKISIEKIDTEAF